MSDGGLYDSSAIITAIENDGRESIGTELRRELTKANEMTLEQLADRTRGDERTSQAERARQVFVLSWLSRNCEVMPDNATPRNHIYERYIEECQGHGIRPLNSATFGKLIRMAYPNIRTRRLGVRGQSKYHYCGIRLLNDDNNVIMHNYQMQTTPSSGGPAAAVTTTSANTTAITASGAAVGGSQSRQVKSHTPTPLTTLSFSQQQQANSEQQPKLEALLESPDSGLLDFSVDFPESLYIAGLFDLPDIGSYIDRDRYGEHVDTFFDQYKVHCNTLIESVRYMRLKQFLDRIGIVHDLMTTEVRDIYFNPSTAAWVRKADLAMYRVCFPDILYITS